MRSVFLFPSLTPSEARQVLDSAFPRNGDDHEEWLVESAIWVRIVDPPYWGDWASDETEVLERSFGGRPDTMIQADVSGRIDGRNEVIRLCRAVLSKGGVATDDYSDKCWPLAEIIDAAGSEGGFFTLRSSSGGRSHDSKRPLTIVHTEYGMCLTTTQFADWREVQEAFSGYKASLGPWQLPEVLEYLPIEYPSDRPFAEESVRWLAKSADATLWAKQLTEEERTKVPVNVRAVAVAAGQLLDRLDDLCDQRPDALTQLLAVIEEHRTSIGESALGRLADASRLRLLDLQAAPLDAAALNHQALAATDELRLLCASTWAEKRAPGRRARTRRRVGTSARCRLGRR